MVLTLLATMMLTAKPHWALVWKDEFNGSGLPDPKIWAYDKGYIANHELQWYSVERTENVRQEGGRLIIEARKDGHDGHPISSARIKTEGKRPFTYGRVEVRAKIPTGRGAWPAIWTLGENIKTVGWKRCGEIDIMENVGFDPDKMHCNIHVPKNSKAEGSQASTKFDVENPYEDFHVYAMEWFPDRIDLFMDGVKRLTYLNDGRGDEETWPFHRPQYLILNVAIGGDWGGEKGVDESILPCRMEVDYVRVYRDRNLKWPTDV